MNDRTQQCPTEAEIAATRKHFDRQRESYGSSDGQVQAKLKVMHACGVAVAKAESAASLQASQRTARRFRNFSVVAASLAFIGPVLMSFSTEHHAEEPAVIRSGIASSEWGQRSKRDRSIAVVRVQDLPIDSTTSVYTPLAIVQLVGDQFPEIRPATRRKTTVNRNNESGRTQAAEEQMPVLRVLDVGSLYMSI